MAVSFWLNFILRTRTFSFLQYPLHWGETKDIFGDPIYISTTVVSMLPHLFPHISACPHLPKQFCVHLLLQVSHQLSYFLPLSGFLFLVIYLKKPTSLFSGIPLAD